MTAAPTYAEFLQAKAQLATASGSEVDPAEVHPALLPHQKAVVQWAVRGGRRAIFASFGLGKSLMQLEIARLVLAKLGGGCGLIVCPLGVRQEFTRDARLLGLEPWFIRTTAEASADGIYLTNYESVRDGKLDPRRFQVVSLDEAAILRGFGGAKTFRELMALYEGSANYRFVATATPSPNEYIELLAYAAFLDILDVGQGKTRFFKRDSAHADRLTLLPHMEEPFWLWVASWALFLTRPSDLGYSDEGYELPPLEVRWHEVPSEASTEVDQHGRGRLWRDPALGVTQAAREKRDSLHARIAKVRELVDEAPPGEHFLLWHDLEAERHAIEDTLPATVYDRWEELRDGNSVALALYERHYSARRYADGRERDRFVGPGEKVVLLTRSRDALFAWRKFRDDSGQQGVCCAVFRNEGPDLSSDLIREAMAIAWLRWPGERLYTYVDPDEVASPNPGDCFKQAGWRTAGRTKDRDLVILEASPDLASEVPSIEPTVALRSVWGSQDLEERERRIIDFSEGRIRLLASKPVLTGSGCNFQYHCHRAIFAGIGFKFADFIQAIHRVRRYLQTEPVRIDLIYTSAEREVRRQLERKWAQHNELVARMGQIIRTYGLSHEAMSGSLRRSIGVQRQQASGEGWLLVNSDAVEETRTMASGSVHAIITSIPFGTQYEYSPSFNDFGHTEDNEHFWAQMDYLTPELLRVLCPGRVLVVHVKDRIVPGGMTGLGFQTVAPFHAEAIGHYQRHGLAYLGMHTVVTDVVRENNQTYRLGWTEQCKDGTRMGCGMPEYLLLFRKPPSDSTNGYADEPVVKSKEDYTRTRWQIDAHGFWRSNGNRPLAPEDLDGLPHERIFKLFRDHGLDEVYDYDHHVALGEQLERTGRLPTGFMLLQPPSWDPDVWTDVARMRTLNMLQERHGRQMHLCVARGSLVLTRDGYKLIQEVTVGEHVLTHKGRWRPVLAVQNTGVRSVVAVKAHGVPGLTLTPDHKLWTRTVRDLPWSRAHSRREAMKTEPGWVPAEETAGSYVNLKLPPVEPASVDSVRYWWIVGRWLADGHISARNGAVISCGRHELDDLLRALGEYGGNPAADTATCAQVFLRDPDHELRRTLKACDTGTAGKHLPPEAYTLPAEQARALLDGYLSGDGHYLPRRRGWTASSVSKELLLGMAILAQRAYGAIASVYPGRPGGTATIQGRTVTTKQDWVLCFSEPSADRYHGLPFVLGDGAWKRVRAVESAGEVETWNLRVAEDESFTAEGCIVKNCPLQFDIVDRLLVRFTRPGETVYDPFAGLGTVPYCAVKLGRRGVGVELNSTYWRDGVAYVDAAARKASIPTLFGLVQESA